MSDWKCKESDHHDGPMRSCFCLKTKYCLKYVPLNVFDEVFSAFAQNLTKSYLSIIFYGVRLISINVVNVSAIPLGQWNILKGW